MEQYPAVQFMVKHGRRLSVAVGLAPPLIAIIGIVFQQWGVFSLVGALILGLLIGFAFRTFAELTQIIADMLLPQ